MKAALAMQAAFAALFGDKAAEDRVAFRMGVNLGDIWVDAEDIYGAGINVAARLEELAEPGDLCISGAVHDAVKHKIAVRYEDLGLQQRQERSGTDSGMALARRRSRPQRSARRNATCTEEARAVISSRLCSPAVSQPGCTGS